MGAEQSACKDCYDYLKVDWGIDCGEDCDYDAARKEMRKVMLKVHPDKHPDEYEKYNKIFQKVSDCNDRVIKDECVKKYKAYSAGAGPQPTFPKEKSWPERPELVDEEFGSPQFKKLIFKDETYKSYEPYIEPAKKIPNTSLSIWVEDTYIGANIGVFPGQIKLLEKRYNEENKWRVFAGLIEKLDKIFHGRLELFPLAENFNITYVDFIHPTKTVWKDGSFRGFPQPSGGEEPKKKPAPKSQKAKGKTQAQKRAECRDKGMVWDRDLDDCRPAKKGAAKRSPRRQSRARRAPRKRTSNKSCPNGQVRSPSGRCIKIGGAAYKKYFGK